MFFEVCLLSLGLFAGSELYKKFEPSAGEKLHNCGLRKKQEQPVFSPASRDKENVERGAVRNHTEFSAALEALTQEVAGLRKDFTDYLAANKEDASGRKELSPAASKRDTASSPSIFKKLIEENVTLRNG